MALSSAVDASAVARVLGIETKFQDLRAGGVLFLPQRVAVIGQGATAAVYSTEKAQFTNAYDVGRAYGFGSPLHLAAKQLLPANGDGVGTIPVTFYPLQADESGAAATGDILPSGDATGSGSFRVSVNNIQSGHIVVAAGDTKAAVVSKIAAAVNSTLDMPVIATADTTTGSEKVDLVAKWAGSSGNSLHIEVAATSPDDTGVTFAVTQPSGGLANPDVQPALDMMGNVWETLVVNCLEISDGAALDAYKTAGEGRWGALVRKPFVAFTGVNQASVAETTAVADSRAADYINCQIPLPGSNELPFVIAARAAARIAVRANNNPARDFGGMPLTGLTPGADGDQWAYPDRDRAVKAGSSTIEVKDGVPCLSDVVTFYHPEGDPLPPYRYVVDIIKLQNIIFNMDLRFGTEEWDGAPLIPDDQPTVNPDAKQPKAAKAEACALWDSLALNAIISSPKEWKANTFAAINSQNPKRLDLSATGPISGNANIISATVNWGFYFGTSPVVR